MLSAERSAPRRLRACTIVLLTGLLPACSDQQLTDPMPAVPDPEGGIGDVRCSVDVRASAVSCAPAATSSGRVALPYSPQFSLGTTSVAPVVPSIILGGQGLYIRLRTDAAQTSYDGAVFRSMVTVENLIRQPIGTVDGTTAAPEGVRIFFSQPPVVTVGTGTITFASQDGTGTFTATEQPYYTFAELLEQNQESAGREWAWNVPATVEAFEFRVLVWAPVQHPQGYVLMTPSAAQLDLSDADALSTTLEAVVHDQIGRDQPGAAITWGSSNTDVATVDAVGVVTAHMAGVATITAQSGAFTGASLITVIQPASIPHSTVSATPTEIPADGASTSTISAILRDARGNALTQSGGTVTLSKVGAGDLGAVTDNGDGTYTATLTAPSVPGTATITAYLDGTPFADPVVITYAVADPDDGYPPAVWAAFSAAVADMRNALASGTLISAIGTAIPPAAQARVLAVLDGRSPPETLAAALVLPEGVPVAESVSNLFNDGTPGWIAAALTNLNVLVQAAPVGYLASPPAEFLTVHAVLDHLMNAVRMGT